MNEKWEYKVCILSYPGFDRAHMQDTTNELNQMGEEGWELVGLDGYQAVFKRKKK